MALVVAAALAGAIAAALAVRATRQAEPRLRREIEVWLSERLNSDVQLAAFDVKLYPVLRVEGRDLVLRIKGRPDLPPFISIQRISGSGGVTTLRRKRLNEVRLEGVTIVVPPGRSKDLEPLRGAGKSTTAPRDPGTPPGPATPEAPLIIDRLVTDSVRLTVLPRDPGRDPQEWDIRGLEMEPFSLDAPTPFSANVDTPLPGERAQVSGTAGPWPQGDFDQLPIIGNYTFLGDVASVPGLYGSLDASGTILGTLERLATTGVVSSPAFGLRTKGAGRLPLSAIYEAVLDGTNGDLFLTKVTTALGSSAFQTAGRVTRVKGVRGRHVAITVKTADRANIADVLKLLVDGGRPPLTGQLALDGTLDLPPGPEDVLDRLTIEASYQLNRVRFADAEVQAKVDELSRRGQGKPTEATIAQVASTMRGRARLRGPRLTLSSVVFEAPGVVIDAAGYYALTSTELQFRGVAKLEATLSRTQTGARRWLLRPLDPFLKKQGAGTRVVVDVRGTKEHPVVDFDVGASLRGRQ